jgi:hypothetical protein
LRPTPRALVFVLASALSGCGGGGATVVVPGPGDFVPHADAGADAVGRVGTLVALDGTASRDPEGSSLTFRWTQVSGPTAVTLSSGAAVQPTFTPTVPGTYVFSLVVEDGATLESSPPATVDVVVIDDLSTTPRRPPAAVARAGGLRRTVFLEVAPSLASPPDVVLADGSVRAVAFVDLASTPSDDPPAAGVDGMPEVGVVVGPAPFARLHAPLLPGDEDPAQVLFDDGSTSDVVSYGVAGEPFVLDGSRSADDGVVRTFSWTQVSGPFRFTTEDGLVEAVVDAPGLYVFELRCRDDLGLEGFPQRLVVPVVPAGLPAAGPPLARTALASGVLVVGSEDGPAVADAGGPFTIGGGGSASRSGGALTYAWEQVSGPRAKLGGGGGTLISVVPPSPGSYVFELVVTDSVGSAQASSLETTVAPADGPIPTPSLLPIPDQVLPPAGSAPLRVVLDGSHSGGGGPLTYRWSQTRGVPLFVEGAATGRGTVVPPSPGLYEFELAVFDGANLSAPVRRRFRVR